MALRLIRPPAIEPVTLAEAKSYLKVDLDDDDVDITSLITMARAHIDGRDGWLGRALLPQEWELVADRFPYSAPLKIMPRVQSIAGITYIDPNSAEQTWAAADYVLDTADDTRSAWIYPAFQTPFPITRDFPGAVRVRFVSGYARSTGTYAFVASTKKISRATGSFLTDGVAIGAGLRTTQASNLGPFTVTAVAALEVTVSDTVVDAAASVVTLYSAADVPEPIKLGMKLLVARYYEHREPILAGAIAVTPLPRHVELLLTPYRVWA